MGQLWLGERLGAATRERDGTRVEVKTSDLATHGVIVGMTGSGKTGLGIVLLEEALLAGIPVLAIDPKGDLGNLALAFPDLAPADFEPWVEGEDPAAAAQKWRDGLASWGLGPERIGALREAAEVTIYTPGSSAGAGLNMVGSLRPPPAGTDTETMRDEVEGFVAGLLGMVGIEADPLASPEFILLANLVERAWAEGTPIDLASLVAQVPEPPLRKLGVFDVDEFFPRDARTKLAMRLNGLLASTAFAAWGAGADLDIDSLLRAQDGSGRPAAAIVSIAHLSDEERQFVVSLLLGKLVTWMRRQPGTADLRVLVYFDEVMGFVPPTAAPPAKKPILTILKQARAFGVGITLVTQNPVDVDYKALSNAGTWMVGRLQTEQDKARLLDGLAAASGGVDIRAMDATISALGKREFVLRRAGSAEPELFTTRWALSYLRGPLTREQIQRLMSGRPQPTAPVSDVLAAVSSVQTEQTTAETPGVPVVADGIAVRWVHPAAAWLPAVGGAPTSTALAPAVALRASLLFDDDAAGLRHTDELEAVLLLGEGPPDPAAAVVVDHDERDFTTTQPEGATYVLTGAPIAQKRYFADLEKAVVEHLHRTRTMEVLRNRSLKLYQRPGEAPEDFARRCDAAADGEADHEAALLRTKYDSRFTKARAALATAIDRVTDARDVATARHTEELASGAGSLLGDLFGGRRGARSLGRAVSGAASRRSRSSAASRKVESAQRKVEAIHEDMAELDAELGAELQEISAEWDAKAMDIDTVVVPLEKNDIAVVEMALVWLPVPAGGGVQ